MQQAPIISFKNPSDWRKWLDKNHTDPVGIWLKVGKKNCPEPSINYAQALDEALCYGWIDGQTKSYDEHWYLIKFTPRRKKSIWSKVNIGHVERLIKAGKIQPPGQAQIDAAKQDGRWDQAYDSPSKATAPADFLAELDKRPTAKAFFATLNKTNSYAIFFRLQTAQKTETRQRRMQQILDMLERQEKFH
jgi:uncharacterized protein YdeI (YjbR/CyaY-like superfamily)